MFPAQCQRWVIGGAVSVKPALNKWDTPPTHTAAVCLSWALSPLTGCPSVLSSKNLWKVHSCLLDLVSGRSSKGVSWAWWCMP